MCLVLYAQDVVPGYRVVLAANRDEFHARPTEALHWWPHESGILAGRDARAGGTWFGVHRDGPFACVLNGPGEPPSAHPPTRGALVPRVLTAADWRSACRQIASTGERFGGFHFLAGDSSEGRYISNTGAEAASLGHGCHTVDNAGLNRNDGRSRRAYRLFRALPDASRASLLTLLADEQPPDGGGGDTRPLFVRDTRFGTRCSTLLWLADTGRLEVIERRFDASGAATAETHRVWNAPAPRGVES